MPNQPINAFTSEKRGLLGRVFYAMQRYFSYAAFASALFLPSISLTWLSGYDDHRLAQLAILILIATAASAIPAGRHAALDDWYTLSPAARRATIFIFGLGLLSSVLAPRPEKALLEVSLFALLFLAFLTMAGQFHRRFEQAIILLPPILLIALTFYLVSFFSAYISALMQAGPVRVRDLFPGFANIRMFNHFHWWLLPMIPVVVRWATTRQGSFRRSTTVAAVFCGAGWWMLLLASESRGAILSAVTGMLVLTAIMGRNAIPWIKIQAVCAAGGGILFWLLFHVVLRTQQAGRLANRVSEFTQDSSRLELWSGALRLAWDNPVLGAGPMHFAYHPNGIAASAHNSLLQWTAEWGPLAAVALLFLIIKGLLAWSVSVYQQGDRSNSMNSILDASLTAALFGAGAHSLVSGIDVPPISQLLLVGFGALALARNRVREDHHTSASFAATYQGKHTIALCCAIALVLAGLFQGLWPEAHILLTSENLSADWPGRDLFYPRFWLRGLIEPAP